MICFIEVLRFSDVDGSTITEDMWGIYYKPDWHFGGIQGGASPYKVDTPVDDVKVDPYGPSSPEFISSKEFAAKYNSKRECYNFLTVDAGVYLPSYE